MPNLRIVPRNFHDEATLATELAPVDGYSIDNTKDTQRSRVWRSTAGTDQYISGTFDDGLSRTISHFSFFRHRCHGGKVRLRLYSDAAWTTQVYDSTALDVINVVPTDSGDWGIDPYGDGTNDPYLLEAPFWLWFTPVSSVLSYRVTFSNNVSTYGYAYWQVCRFFLGHYFEPAFQAQYGALINVTGQADRNRSRGGSLRRNVGPRWRTMSMDMIRVPDTDRAMWLDIKNRLGTDRDFVFSLFPGDGTRKERDHVMNCVFTSYDGLERWHHAGFLKQRIQLEEV